MLAKSYSELLRIFRYGRKESGPDRCKRSGPDIAKGSRHAARGRYPTHRLERKTVRTGRPKGILSPLRDVQCVICAAHFQTRHSQGRYCSPECRRVGHRANEDKWVIKNPDKVKANSAKMYRQNVASVTARVKEYVKTPLGKSVRRKVGINQRKRFPEKVAARSAVSKAIKTGALLRQPCEICGKSPADAHHPDYAKPLMVTWLCRTHHREEHERMKSAGA